MGNQCCTKVQDTIGISCCESDSNGAGESRYSTVKLYNYNTYNTFTTVIQHPNNTYSSPVMRKAISLSIDTNANNKSYAERMNRKIFNPFKDMSIPDYNVRKDCLNTSKDLINSKDISHDED